MPAQELVTRCGALCGAGNVPAVEGKSSTRRRTQGWLGLGLALVCTGVLLLWWGVASSGASSAPSPQGTVTASAIPTGSANSGVTTGGVGGVISGGGTSGGGTTAGDGSTGTAAPGSTGNATGNAATPGMSVADTVKAVSGLITSLAGLIVAMPGFLALLRQRRSTSPATPSDTPPANDGQPRLWRPGDDL